MCDQVFTEQKASFGGAQNRTAAPTTIAITEGGQKKKVSFCLAKNDQGRLIYTCICGKTCDVRKASTFPGNDGGMVKVPAALVCPDLVCGLVVIDPAVVLINEAVNKGGAVYMTLMTCRNCNRFLGKFAKPRNAGGPKVITVGCTGGCRCAVDRSEILGHSKVERYELEPLDLQRLAKSNNPAATLLECNGSSKKAMTATIYEAANGDGEGMEIESKPAPKKRAPKKKQDDDEMAIEKVAEAEPVANE